MTYDQDSQALVTLTLNEVMMTYSYQPLDREHLAILSQAVKESQQRFDRALKKGDTDAMLGLAVKLEAYCDKLRAFTKKVAEAGE